MFSLSLRKSFKFGLMHCPINGANFELRWAYGNRARDIKRAQRIFNQMELEP
jgi:hypothetical protein